VHIVAGNLDAAQQEWVQAAGRDRADLGLDQARAVAAAEAQNYAPTTPRVTGPRSSMSGRNRRPSFVDRMQQVNTKLARSNTATAAAEPAMEADEYLQYEAGNQHRHHGPRL